MRAHRCYREAMEYLSRLIDVELARLRAVFPCVSVVGPRAAGKTTSAARSVASITRLDQPAVAGVFLADPDAALMSRPEPALLDEWQEVPGVLGAIKRAVDVDPRPNRFVLTGSVSAELDVVSWPGTGRVIRIPMRGLTLCEQRGTVDIRPTVRNLLAGNLRLPSTTPTLVDYVDMALVGGFPEAVALSDVRDRRVWYESYIEQLVTRDSARAGVGRDTVRLRRYLQALALNSAGVINDVTLYQTAGIDRRTHLAYEGLLRNIFVVDQVQAWTSNRMKRLAQAPKRFVEDVGLMAAAARVGRDDILKDIHLLGRVIETFVRSELVAHLSVNHVPTFVSHVRTAGGREEVDLVVEFDGGATVGIEVKATATPKSSDARHLFWMREALGASFAGGVVFHTGPEIIRFDDTIAAIPISAFWGSAAV